MCRVTRAVVSLPLVFEVFHCLFPSCSVGVLFRGSTVCLHTHPMVTMCWLDGVLGRRLVFLFKHRRMLYSKPSVSHRISRFIISVATLVQALHSYSGVKRAACQLILVYSFGMLRKRVHPATASVLQASMFCFCFFLLSWSSG